MYLHCLDHILKSNLTFLSDLSVKCEISPDFIRANKQHLTKVQVVTGPQVGKGQKTGWGGGEMVGDSRETLLCHS